MRGYLRCCETPPAAARAGPTAAAAAAAHLRRSRPLIRRCRCCADSMPVRPQTTHSAGFWQASQRAVANARCGAAGGDVSCSTP